LLLALAPQAQNILVIDTLAPQAQLLQEEQDTTDFSRQHNSGFLELHPQ